jgi:hypothetical protein
VVLRTVIPTSSYLVVSGQIRESDE